MALKINGVSHPELAEQDSVIQLLAAVGLQSQQSGVAVAIDGTVVPRSKWAECPVPEGSIIEIVRATQGG